jgi:hypothetical protein
VTGASAGAIGVAIHPPIIGSFPNIVQKGRPLPGPLAQ